MGDINKLDCLYNRRMRDCIAHYVVKLSVKSISLVAIRTAVAIPLLSPSTQLAAAESPKFDVASVRVNPRREAAPTKIVDSTPGRFTVTNMPVRFLISYAWDLHG